MDNRDLAEKIYSDLNEKGADLSNVSIVFIEKILNDNGVKNCSTHNVVDQSEQFTPKQLWIMAQKYNADDFIKIVKEIGG